MSNLAVSEKKRYEEKRKKYGKFALQKFKNPSGNVIWRVSGSINGRRIRKNFENKDDATAEKQRLDLKQKAEHNYERVVVTSLTREQCEEAKIAFRLLEGRKKSLSYYVQFALERYREAEFEVTVEAAVDEYLKSKRIEQSRNIITAIQLRRINAHMGNFKKKHGKALIGEVDFKQVQEDLDSGVSKDGTSRVSPKTFNNKRGFLSTFFRFCVQQDWIVFNPIDKIPTYTVKANRGSAETISAGQAAEIMEFLETYEAPRREKGFLVPYFALCLFAGIRPDSRIGEISRLKGKDVRLDTGVILIEPEVSKVDEKRAIKIQPNLRLWLEKYPVADIPIIPLQMEHHRTQIRAHFKLAQNVLRHTFISMTVGAFKSVGDAALQAGNSEKIIRKHYLDLKTEAEADAFWRIVPKGTNVPSNLVKMEGRFREAKELKAVS
jgi:integrase